MRRNLRHWSERLWPTTPGSPKRMCKTLQNSKALASTNVPDGMYYELTYNGDKRELYVDAYSRQANFVVLV